MGEIAALVTAFFWTLSSILFTFAGKQVGSLTVNRIRLLLATILLLITHLILTGQILPLNAEPYRWLWLSLSGIVGLAIGDSFLYQSYVLVGNRLGTLLMATVPVIGGLEAWFLLGETLNIYEMMGISLCLFGICMVVFERRNANHTQHTRRQYVLGILCALASAVGQANGMILAKKGLGGDFSAISATVIRTLAGLLALWLVTLFMKQAKSTLLVIFQHPSAMRFIGGGTIVGPFLGVWLSMVAVQYAPVGVASTLLGLTPIMLLPISKWVLKEYVSPRTILWTCVALTGTAIIFLKP